jgi:glutamate-5-semialdehyde dehydrogenase
MSRDPVTVIQSSGEESPIDRTPGEAHGMESMLRKSRQAAVQMAMLSSEQKNQALETLARLLHQQQGFLIAENAKDLEAQRDVLAPALFGRLKLDGAKINQLVQGTEDLIALADPVGRILSRTLLDDGLTLEKRTVPLGVIGIIFESRPDVMPQILALILKSGNAVVFKGGSEASHSNRAMMTLVQQLNAAHSFLPEGWATLLESREAVQDMLNYPQYVDLVIPRGSNALVQSIMQATRIPVLGHADGVCHLYVHQSADKEQALRIIVDAKTQYPSACNSVETLLIDEAIAENFLPRLAEVAAAAGIQLKGDALSRRVLPQIPLATEADWRTEYGDLTLSVKLVGSPEVAIEHINQYGSHHTDGILADDPVVEDQFLDSVDSASVMVNASTRFADGFRYGLGAEIGISTARTHARGPVGLEGLIIYKYRLMGNGHIVADYVGNPPQETFKHIPLDPDIDEDELDEGQTLEALLPPLEELPLTVRSLTGQYAVCRVERTHPLPDWATVGRHPDDAFRAVIQTSAGWTIVCPEDELPLTDPPADCERNWRLFCVEGPLDFGLTGIMHRLTQPLAEARIPALTLSSFETDYLLVSAGDYDRAIEVLRTRFTVLNGH